MAVILVALGVFWTLCFEGGLVALLGLLGLPWRLGAFLALPLAVALAVGFGSLFARAVRPWLSPPPPRDRFFEEAP